MTTKEKADALVDKHQQATMSFLNERQKLINAIKNAILSVEHTIEMLRELNGSMIKAEDCMIISQKITKQTELLTELKSRI